MNNIMRSVNIKNKEILEILNSFVDIWWDKKETDLTKFELIGDKSKRDYYISDQYKNKILNLSTTHDGYPEEILSYSLKISNRPNAPQVSDLKINSDYIETNQKMQRTLGTKHNALCSVYPPGGFISWHNNANASAYNLIFTWSENGNGYWKHIDPYTGKDVVVQDVPGWQCKAFYFGAYKDKPEDIVYHMASTDCWRMTVSYIFDRTHKQFWEDIIEDIETK
jgi:hypothetical protein